MLAETLTDETDCNWRSREVDLFLLLDRLCAGDVPDQVQDLAPDGLRRLGYLADVALYLLEPERPERLRELASRLRGSLTGHSMQPLAVVIM